ncbi:MAG: formate--tetrahydrofolate ligase [Candidatus Micrarchaeia archaeon]
MNFLQHGVIRVSRALGILDEEFEPYSFFAGKISLNALKRLEKSKSGRLILVTAMTPTKAGEGKTTTTIGLCDAFWKLGKCAVATIREPSLGPVFGVKGGATGGGKSVVVPPEEINLHLTGDIHAITSAHNLLAALLYNHLHQGNELGIDEKTICWPYAMDMSCRELREIRTACAQGSCRHSSGFVITAASEVMAVLCLAGGYRDLRERLARIVVAFDRKGRPVTAADLKAHGAMAALLRAALKPNLLLTGEGNPCFIHGGPFANTAHGTNSILATRLALKLAGEKGFVITETGFGSELGAEKFLHIAAPALGTTPSAAVLVASARAVRLHGLANLEKHIDNMKKLGVPTVVALNRFPGDSEEELARITSACEHLGVKAVTAECFSKGGAGALALAKEVERIAKKPCPLSRQKGSTLFEKIDFIAREFYGADGVDFSEDARKKLEHFASLGFGSLPVCMAKTQHSLSDDKNLAGRPTGFRVKVNDARLSAGAGFVVAVLGEVLLMPGLPEKPAAERITLSDEGNIIGLA